MKNIIVIVLAMIVAPMIVTGDIIVEELGSVAVDGYVAGIIRAAGTGKEILASDDGDEYVGDDITFVHPINMGGRIYYDSEIAEFGIGLTPSGGTEILVTVTLGDWFNVATLTIGNYGGPIIPDFTLTGNSINGTSFRDLDASSHGVAEEFFDGILFEFVGNDETNQESFEALFNLNASAPFGAGGDMFRLEFELDQVDLQTVSVPEVSTTMNFLVGGLTLLLFRRLKLPIAVWRREFLTNMNLN